MSLVEYYKDIAVFEETDKDLIIKINKDDMDAREEERKKEFQNRLEELNTDLQEINGTRAEIRNRQMLSLGIQLLCAAFNVAFAIKLSSLLLAGTTGFCLAFAVITAAELYANRGSISITVEEGK